MTHLSTSQQTSRILHNQTDDRSNTRTHSIVRDRVRKFDMLKSSHAAASTPPPRPPPIRPSVPMKKNFNPTDQNNGTSSSSIGSLSGSPHCDYFISGNPINRSNLNSSIDKSLTKHSFQSTRASRSPKSRRRTPPPIPSVTRDFSKSRQQQYEYSNHAMELDETPIDNTENDIYELQDEIETEPPKTFKAYAQPAIVSKELPIHSPSQYHDHVRVKLVSNGHRMRDEKPSNKSPNQLKGTEVESIGLEIDEPVLPPRRHIFAPNVDDDIQYSSAFTRHTPKNEIPSQQRNRLSPSSYRQLPPPPPPLPGFNASYIPGSQRIIEEETQPPEPKRVLPLTNFMIEIGALIVVFILCMVLVLAIREDETTLRTTMQLIYSYIYTASIVWMIWCTLDIVKFRREWMSITAEAVNHDEYMDISENYSHKMFYFPDVHNSGGLFMKVGAGLLCMGGLILTIIELSKTIAMAGLDKSTRVALVPTYYLSVTITKSLTYILRFLFHCVQFTFIFRYGNLVINHHLSIAKIGLIHMVVANFCTWFEAIVFETLEQLHKNHEDAMTTSYPIEITYSTKPTTATTATTITTTSAQVTSIFENNTFGNLSELIRGMAASATSGGTSSNTSTYDIITQIESTMNVYLYPCLIEYSLISLIVFFIMWSNVGKVEKRSFLRFGDRHVFTVNCSRASRGLVIGGIILLLTILTLIPTYLLNEDAIIVTHITELVLLSASLFTVGVAFSHITKLHYNEDEHVDAFDRILILLTTVGDFAYSFFGLFASIFVDQSESRLPIGVEISIGLLAIFQTFLQSGFILDALKRRIKSKQEIRQKPGREAVTALLLINLAIWLHDSLSAKKVRLNPIQIAYYDAGTWAIIQAFTSPLSIFYRFHSSVCLADIWQEVYHDDRHINGTRTVVKSGNRNSAIMHDSEHS